MIEVSKSTVVTTRKRHSSNSSNNNNNNDNETEVTLKDLMAIISVMIRAAGAATKVASGEATITT